MGKMEVRNEAEFAALQRWGYGEHVRTGRRKDFFLVVECHMAHSEEPQEEGLTEEQLRALRRMSILEREAHHRRSLAATVAQFNSPAVETKLCSVDAAVCPSAATGVQILPACRIYRNGGLVAECWPSLRATHDALKGLIEEASNAAVEENTEEDVGPVPFEALIEDVSLSSSNVTFTGADALPIVEEDSNGWQRAWSGMATPQSSARLRELIGQFAKAPVGTGPAQRMAVLWYKAQWCGSSRMLSQPLSLLSQYYAQAPGILLVEVDIDLCEKFVLSGEGIAGAVLCRPGERSEAPSRSLRLPCFVCVEYTTDGGGGEDSLREHSRVLTYDVSELAERLASFARKTQWRPGGRPSVQVEEVDYAYEPPLVEDDVECTSDTVLHLETSQVAGAVIQALADLRKADTRCSHCKEPVASPSRSSDPLLMLDDRLCHGSHQQCAYCKGSFSLEQLLGCGPASSAFPPEEEKKDNSAMESNIVEEQGPPFTIPLLPAAWNFRPVVGRQGIFFHSLCLERARRAAFLRYAAGSRLNDEQRANVERVPTFAYDADLVLSATRSSENTFVFGYFDDGSDEKKVQELHVRQVTGVQRQVGLGSGTPVSSGDLQIFFRDPGCSLMRCLETQTGGIVRLNEQRLRLDFNRAFLTRTWAPWKRPTTDQEREAQLAQLRKMVEREEEALDTSLVGFAVQAGERPLFDPGLREEQGAAAGVGRWMKAALFSAIPAAVGAFLWSQNKK